MFRSELTRAFRNKGLVLGVAITTCVIVYGFLDSWHFYQMAQDNPQFGYHPYYFNAYEIFLFALKFTPFTLFAILAATAPFADSLVVDRDSGYMRYAIFRGGYWRYLLSKLVANWMVGGTAVALAMTLAFSIACILFPVHLPPLYENGVKVSIMGVPHSPLGFIFETMPGLYVLGRLGLGFLFGGAYATLGFAISSVARNRYVVLAVPLIIFIVATVLSDLLGFYGWEPPVAITPEVNINSSAITMLTNYVVIYGVSLLVVFMKLNQSWVVKGQRLA